MDFPCGSGYGAKLLSELAVSYEGQEFDLPTIEYAKSLYGKYDATFVFGDLTKPDLPENKYDVIGCIEGLEHIGREFQEPLIEAFQRALKPGGTLIISSPEAPNNISGPSPDNEWHVWELTKDDFLKLLHSCFPAGEVELITQKNVLHTGKLTNCFYAVCRKS